MWLILRVVLLLAIGTGVFCDTTENLFHGETVFYDTAMAVGGETYTDKVGALHHYQTM